MALIVFQRFFIFTGNLQETHMTLFTRKWTLNVCLYTVYRVNTKITVFATWASRVNKVRLFPAQPNAPVVLWTYLIGNNII